MDSSRRAVESYWRSRMIDGVTSDEDKVAPVYKLEEVCELLRSSHVSIVKEVSEFILKRLDHKSPIVKQKALRLIKYAIGKSGVEFRREMQRHSVAVKQLFHYKGQLDPLKGDALNKAVRDTAQETISAIFSAEDNKPAPAEDVNRRIQGFGSTNYEMPSEDKKSFLSEVVGLGSASIKHGFNSFTQGHSVKKNDNGSYKSPHLRRSLTTETEYQDRHEPVSENQGGFSSSRNVASGPWNQDSRTNKTEITNGGTSSSYTQTKDKTREERLLETIVTSGGVRLQPTREAIHVFLVEAAKLDAVALSLALESKLQSPMWQVRMKAVCVLEAVLRKNDDEHFSIVATYFSENVDVLVRCSESPQTSLREKANKVLSLLGTEQGNSSVSNPEKPKNVSTTTVQLPDLIDTDGPNYYNEADSSVERQSEPNIANLKTPTTPLVDDLFGDSVVTSLGIDEPKNDDPFADVSFLPPKGDKEQGDDLFAGLSVDDNKHAVTNKSGSELFDLFGSDSAPQQELGTQKQDHNDLMAGLSINEHSSKMTQKGISSGALSETIFAASTTDPHLSVSNNGLNGLFGSQVAGNNANVMFPTGALPYNVSPGFMYNPAFPTQPMNYSNMGNFLAQQQLLATMSNFQHLGNLNNQNMGMGHVTGTNEGYSSSLPDIFQPNAVTQIPSVGMNNLKKEDTKAFDFISDHLASSRGPKRVA